MIEMHEQIQLGATFSRSAYLEGGPQIEGFPMTFYGPPRAHFLKK
ncbi:hypothetical protein QG37_06187 [Candidozyma auris]|uniref:Uncharacterized protein n=1 Tax=Candidozyma auris TaxID=498019 RepID=A0A0L0NUC5_CANAR|nr:hypothetical protein QG37_06187 [[Candida] auris]